MYPVLSVQLYLQRNSDVPLFYRSLTIEYYEVNLTTTNATSYYYLGGQLIAQRKNATLTYVHQDNLGSTNLITDSSGSLVESIKYFSFGATRSSTGTDVTDKKFTGQRLDSTGLYYYGARYYDPNIGRFLSPDSASPDLTSPQSFNKYTYCFNNPLKYNDPTGNWPHWVNKLWGDIKHGAQAVVNTVVTKAVEIKQTVVQTFTQVNQAISNIYQDVKQIISEKAKKVGNLIGIESTSTMDTSMAKNIPVINFRQGSLIDKLLPSNTQTIYPIGVFTSVPMDPKIKEEEGFHWKDQSTAGIFVPVWYASYGIEYAVNYVAYWGNDYYAHNAVSFEKAAMGYAGTGNPPPPPHFPPWK